MLFCSQSLASTPWLGDVRGMWESVGSLTSLQIWTRSGCDHLNVAAEDVETVGFVQSMPSTLIVLGRELDDSGCSPAGKGSQIVLVARYVHDRSSVLSSSVNSYALVLLTSTSTGKSFSPVGFMPLQTLRHVHLARYKAVQFQASEYQLSLQLFRSL